MCSDAKGNITEFFKALEHGNLPAVSFLKAPAYQDGHAGYSDPLDEQRFLVSTINRLEDAADAALDGTGCGANPDA